MIRKQTRIDIEMAERGIRTDTKLAEMLGFTPSELSQRIRGKISIDTLERISTLFGITVKELLK